MASEILCGQIDPATGEMALCDACRAIARIEAMFNDETEQDDGE